MPFFYIVTLRRTVNWMIWICSINQLSFNLYVARADINNNKTITQMSSTTVHQIRMSVERNQASNNKKAPDRKTLTRVLLLIFRDRLNSGLNWWQIKCNFDDIWSFFNCLVERSHGPIPKKEANVKRNKLNFKWKRKQKRSLSTTQNVIMPYVSPVFFFF